ncbi:MAG: nucleotidyl transferase AbiEii/AbiGii toxin family protein [Steroidobacteraceae bacterium]
MAWPDAREMGGSRQRSGGSLARGAASLMIPSQLVRRYAHNQQVGLDVADQEIVLHYALGLLNKAQLMGRQEDGSVGPLLFKGGTALRKCMFGSEGRFSQDIDLDAPYKNGFEAAAEAAFVDRSPFHGITFSIVKSRWSEDGDENFSGIVEYDHAGGSGRFELQISYRLNPVLAARDLALVAQEYFSRVEFAAPTLHGLDPYEMIGEKIMACNRRQGGSAKDIYDLYLWSAKPFDAQLVRRVAVLKAWTDQRRSRPYDAEALLAAMVPGNFRWSDLNGLVPRKQHSDRDRICRQARERFATLTDLTEDEQALLADQTSHREEALFKTLVVEAREMRQKLG